MKLTSTFTLVLAALPCIVSVSALPQRGQRQGGQRGGQRGGQQGQNRGGQQQQQGQGAGQQGQQQQGQGQQQGQQNNGTQNNQQGQGQQNNGTQNNAGGGQAAGGQGGQGGDPQTSTTLDPKVIATGFANDGQDQPTAGQVASLTSTNNFINFCLTVPNLPITNGKQIQTGSCNPAPIGVIPSVDNMPSAKFTNPANGGNVQANTPFTVSMAVKNLVTGNFVNAQENYFAAPQQLNGQGQIIGHTHVVIETLTDLAQTTPTNPKQFAFFKGINGAAQGGIVQADVDKGLPPGAYRMCSINSSANHQPVIVPIAQHGSLDDCVYFTAGGAAGQQGGAAGQNNGQNGGAAGAGGAQGQQGGAAGTGAAQTGQQGGAAGAGGAQGQQGGATGAGGAQGQQGGAAGAAGAQGQQAGAGGAAGAQKGQQAGAAGAGAQKGQQAGAGAGAQKGQQAQGQNGQQKGQQPQPAPAQGQKGQQGQGGRKQ